MKKEPAHISHFLNPQEATPAYGNGGFHPLDIRIAYRNEIIRIRSRICEYLRFYQSDVKKLSRENLQQVNYIMTGYFTTEFFDRIMKDRLFPIYDLLVDEARLIHNIIEFNEPFDIQHFTPRNFSREYAKHTTEISHLLDDRLKELYLAEVKGLFAKNVDPQKSKEVFRVCNYFVHYINWNNSFAGFYETTFEVMPKGLKLIENFFSEKLQTVIKAYMAFSTQVKIIRRRFEKMDPGKISILSYFEWEKDIREFLLKNFDKIFGSKVAEKYVNSLHEVLYHYMLDSSLKQ
ncbi:MAG: hypothetical protein ACP5D1_08685 [Bacteroidales bacterium]